MFQRVSSTRPSRGIMQAALHRSMYACLRRGSVSTSVPATHRGQAARATAQERSIWNLAKGFGFGTKPQETL